MIGPVQEKDTSAKVKAMKNMESRPVVLSTLESILLVKREGSVISNPPMKEIANTTSRRKKNTLNQALVERAFRAVAPKMAVTSNPSST